MANVSVAVEIETRIERDLSIAFQGVADDQSVNVGTLLGECVFSTLQIFNLETEGACLCSISHSAMGSVRQRRQWLLMFDDRRACQSPEQACLVLEFPIDTE